MKPILIVNDLHLGTQRSAGTTYQTAADLKEFLFTSFEDIILAHQEKDLLINGDLFDKFSEDEATVNRTFEILHRWLALTGNTLHNIPGNHDFSAKADKLSSWHLLANVLKTALPKQVVNYGPEFAKINDFAYVVPHCLNTDLFELELDKALDIPVEKGTKLFLHANLANNFADFSDHSLNLTEERGRKLMEHGYQLIVAHEHYGRCVNFTEKSLSTLSNWDPEADVIVTGNQFPSSISDCLSHGQAQRDGRKYAHILNGYQIERVQTWDNTGNFISVEWSDLARVENQKFIRVTGRITKDQSAEVLDAITKFRSKSKAFVVTNSLQIEGVTLMDSEAEFSAEDIRSFNIVEEFLALFSGKEQAVLRPLIEGVTK